MTRCRRAATRSISACSTYFQQRRSGELAAPNSLEEKIHTAGSSITKTIPALLLLLLVTSCAEARQPDDELNIGQSIDAVFSPIANQASRLMFWDPFAAAGIYDPVIYVDGMPLKDKDGEVKKVRIPLLVIWLILMALFFTFRMGFINVRGFTHIFGLVSGRYDRKEDPGEVSHFQALSTALSGTIGLGNIAGVAIAISMGGPGATFWMFLAGFFGMSSKFVECTLGVKYRKIDEKGRVLGGPMYYLRMGLARKRIGRFSLAGLGKVLGFTWAFFAILGSLGGGNMFQANQSFTLTAAVIPALEGHGAAFGLAMALMVGMVIFGGIKSIGKVTGKLVPLMAALYIGTSLIIIFANIARIDEVVVLIFSSALNASALKGGLIGVMVIGLKRAAFSNEAGVGTAAIAHSATRTSEPVSEGIVGSSGPMVDTMIICTMTALVLIFTGYHQGTGELQGAAMTAAAFGSVFSWFPYLLTVAIILFSFSTQISFAYYGQQCFDYCFGGVFERIFKRRELGRYIFSAIFLLCVVVGASSSVRAVMNYSDMIIFALAFTNTIGMLLMSSEVRNDMRSYMTRLKEGKIRPVNHRA